jgi:hypothetical protein
MGLLPLPYDGPRSGTFASARSTLVVKFMSPTLPSTVVENKLETSSVACHTAQMASYICRSPPNYIILRRGDTIGAHWYLSRIRDTSYPDYHYWECRRLVSNYFESFGVGVVNRYPCAYVPQDTAIAKDHRNRNCCCGLRNIVTCICASLFST